MNTYLAQSLRLNSLSQVKIKINKIVISLIIAAAMFFAFTGCKGNEAIGNENYDASVSLISYEMIDDEFDGVTYREVTNLSQLVAESDIPLLIAFYQPMHDINIDVIPVLEEIAVEYDNKIRIVWIDVSRETSLAEQFSVSQTPYFIIVDQSIIKRSLTGFSIGSKQDITELISQYTG